MTCGTPLFSTLVNHGTTLFNKNSTGNHTFDDLLAHCWPHNECGDCLRQGCSWCPMSSACVPNLNRIHILEPIFNPDICPLWSERWELRTGMFGCSVSTLTFLTCIVTMFATLLAVGLIAGSTVASKLIRRRWRARSDGWWKISCLRVRDKVDDGAQDEERPLLG